MIEDIPEGWREVLADAIESESFRQLDPSRHDPGEVVERDCGDHRKGEPGTILPFESLG